MSTPLIPIPKTVTEQLKLVKTQAGEQSAAGLSVVRMDTVEVEPVEWLWQPFIARKKLTALTGEEGIGKSWITCAFASIVSNGGWFPNTEAVRVEPENVLFLASEDGLEDTIKPRLDAVGADQKRVFCVRQHFSFDDVGILRFHNLVADVRPALVIIDPFFSYLRGGLNINLATEIRPITSKLSEIAEEYNAAFLLVRHIGKSKGAGDPRSAGLGSIDLRAVCRSELLIGKNPDDAQDRAIVQTKNNLAEYGESVGYEIRESSVFFKDTSLTAERILSGASGEDERNTQTEAVAFLREILTAGEQPASEIIKQANSLSITQKMLRTARMKLNVEVFRRGNAFGGNQKWFWRLPEERGENSPAD
jgi:hypothetical protein